MKLETRINMLIGAVIIAATVGVYGLIYGRNHHIKENLEPGPLFVMPWLIFDQWLE